MEYRPTGSLGLCDDPDAIENASFSGDFADCMRIRSGTQKIPPKRSHIRDASGTIHTSSFRSGIDVFDMHQNILPGRYRQKKDRTIIE
jgi:hypothetical protein